MDGKAIERLDARARALAEKLGFHASIRLEAADDSQIQPGDPKLVLTVYHEGQERRTAAFRPDQPDLPARIEQAIPLLAQELGKH
jgi:hypothetical protein